ncbi:MAG: hypothetical protein GMKNLPBB_03057 [Myxococcota bacterium]|nr:hypothetical protein [Myxococcota bacterium]
MIAWRSAAAADRERPPRKQEYPKTAIESGVFPLHFSCSGAHPDSLTLWGAADTFRPAFAGMARHES